MGGAVKTLLQVTLLFLFLLTSLISCTASKNGNKDNQEQEMQNLNHGGSGVYNLYGDTYDVLSGAAEDNGSEANRLRILPRAYRLRPEGISTTPIQQKHRLLLLHVKWNDEQTTLQQESALRDEMKDLVFGNSSSPGLNQYLHTVSNGNAVTYDESSLQADTITLDTENPNKNNSCVYKFTAMVGYRPTDLDPSEYVDYETRFMNVLEDYARENYEHFDRIIFYFSDDTCGSSSSKKFFSKGFGPQKLGDPQHLYIFDKSVHTLAFAHGNTLGFGSAVSSPRPTTYSEGLYITENDDASDAMGSRLSAYGAIHQMNMGWIDRKTQTKYYDNPIGTSSNFPSDETIVLRSIGSFNLVEGEKKALEFVIESNTAGGAVKYTLEYRHPNDPYFSHLIGGCGDNGVLLLKEYTDFKDWHKLDYTFRQQYISVNCSWSSSLQKGYNAKSLNFNAEFTQAFGINTKIQLLDIDNNRQAITIRLFSGSVGGESQAYEDYQSISDCEGHASGSKVFTTNQGLVLHQNQVEVSGDTHLAMQGDGNLVLYDASSPTLIPLWDSQTGIPGVSNAQSYFVFQNDGNMVVYNSSHIYQWASMTSVSKGAERLIIEDGHMKICSYHDKMMWSSLINKAQ